MYDLNVTPTIIDKQALVAKTNAIDKTLLWHHRLGHTKYNVTRQLGFDVLILKCKAYKIAKSH